LVLLTELYPFLWGRDATNDAPAIKAIHEFVTVHNQRSGGKEGLYNRSYNLAGTSSEGQGTSLVMPAIQTSDSQARLHISRVLQIIHKLYRLIMPLCVSKLEWEVIEFHGKLCNLMSFGGWEPGPTACQLNVSSGSEGGDLVDFLGEQQGAVHVDEKDDPCRWTLIFIFLRIPLGN
jgi:hypothetical protein